jgi:Spy/CpxP family protein refolding chaperone
MRKTFLLALAVAVGLSLAIAQPPQEKSGGRQWERISQWRKIRLIEMLSLTEDQSVRFFARMNEHDVARRELIRAKGEALDRLDRMVRNKAEAQEYEKVIPEVVAADEKIRAEQKRFFDSLPDVLSPEQRAKFLLFERQFEKELREAMREVQRRRMPPDQKE